MHGYMWPINCTRTRIVAKVAVAMKTPISSKGIAEAENDVSDGDDATRLIHYVPALYLFASETARAVR